MDWFKDPESVQERVQKFCWENKVKRKQEWESHRTALERMKESKEQQQHGNRTKRKEMLCMLKYYRISKELELLWEVPLVKLLLFLMRNIRLTLTEDDFLTIQWKMDRTDQKLNDLYRNWQAEYRSAITSKDCKEVKRFYKPYLKK